MIRTIICAVLVVGGILAAPALIICYGCCVVSGMCARAEEKEELEKYDGL